MSAIVIWGGADPPPKKEPAEANRRAKQLNGTGAKASAQNTLAPRSAATAKRRS